MTIPRFYKLVFLKAFGPSASACARDALIVASLALAAGAVAFQMLPQSTFSAVAIVGVEGAAGGLRPAMIQAAVEAAVSRPVMARAAASLLGSAAAPAAPDGQALAILARSVRVSPSELGGTLLVRAGDPDAARAATLANAAATALVAELDEHGLVASADPDAARLDHLQAAAAAAHRRLAALDGGDAAQETSRAAALARVDLLRTRLDAIRAILASGTPPLGMGKDVPPAIDALQTSYLDLNRQLATARESLGERHTTVIGLEAALKRTTAELAAAWTRLAKSTEADLAAARGHAAALDQDGAPDRAKSAAASVNAARAAAQAADDAVARAQEKVQEAPARFRLVARASVPAFADGLPQPLRLAAACAAGLLGLALGLWLVRRPGPQRRIPAPMAATEPDLLPAAVEPRFFRDDPAFDAPEAPAHADVATWLDDRLHEPALLSSLEPDLAAPKVEPARHAPAPSDELSPGETARQAAEGQRTRGFTAAATGVLSAIARLVPRRGVRVVLVASNERGAATMDAALALGEAAASEGHRVLVVEGSKARPALAAAVAAEAEPALVDVFDELRVVLAAETGAGLLYVAPSFKDGARLAADLARGGEVLVADSLADEFDLVIIDGNEASDASSAVAHADAVLRVGRFVSARDDERLLATLAAPRAALLGTLTASAFSPSRDETPEPQPLRTRDTHAGSRRPSPPAPAAAYPRRRAAMR